MARKKTSTLFEDSMQELDAIVEQLEAGDLSLNDALKSFERGVKLTRTCRSALDAAQQKVHILVEQDDGQQTLEPFTNE